MNAFPVSVVDGWPVRPVDGVVVAWEGPNTSAPGLSELLTAAAGPLAVACLDDNAATVLEPFGVDADSDMNPLLQLEFARGGARLVIAPADGGWWLLDAIDLEVTLFCAGHDQVRSVLGIDAADSSVVLGSWLADDIVTPAWQAALEDVGRRYNLPVVSNRSAERERAQRYAARLTDATQSMDILRSPFATAQQVLQVVATFKPAAQANPSWHDSLQGLTSRWETEPASRAAVDHDLRNLISSIRAEPT